MRGLHSSTSDLHARNNMEHMPADPLDAKWARTRGCSFKRPMLTGLPLALGIVERKAP
jgi:hypothetical protein